jgi:urease accessory protein
VGERGRVELAVERLRGRTRLVRCTSSGLLAARATPWGVLLLAQTAHVVGDDRIEIEIDIAAGAQLSVGTVGATLARPGPLAHHEPALTTVRARLGEEATLCWWPEPGIAAPASRHRAEADIELAAGAGLRWHEEVVLGRTAEPATGTWWSSLRCSYAGRPLLASEVGLGPEAAGWSATSVLGEARAYTCLLLAGERAPAACWPGPTGSERPAGRAALEDRPVSSRGGVAAVARTAGARGASLPLEGPGREIVAAGSTLAACRRVVAVLAGGVDLRP